ncbi:MAG: ABC transporter permease [Syntrophomonadaceae bacterium]|jgi:putative ABC transport system permease protein
MNLLELFTVALASIRSNKLRSFLTTLGIVIGIAAVISVVAIGQGGRAMLIEEMEKFGTNLFVVYVNYREDSTAELPDLQVDDVTVIKKMVPEVKYMAPVSYSQLRLRGTVGVKTLQVLGTNADYEQVRKLNMVQGRFITPEDEAVSRAVIVIQEDTAKELFGNENPLGQRVVVNNNTALVIGLVKTDTSALGFDSQQIAYLPLSFLRTVTGWNQIHQIYGSAGSKEEVALAMERSKSILERRHNAPDGHYVCSSMEEEMQAANKITGIISLVISFIAGISLLVGGIGVMNIMLVSVTERTREIGIRMALGAQRRDIMVQFLFESIVLCLMGGLIGTILGYGGAFLVAKIANWPPLVSWWTILIAFLFSTTVGLFFGLYPANQAARLNPIEALRRE